MTQALFLLFAASLPLVALAAIGRGVLCIFRTSRAGNWQSAILAGVGIVVMLLIFAAAAGFWLIEAVSHGPKNQVADWLGLAGSGVLIYVAAAGIQWFARHAEAPRGRSVPASEVNAERARPEPKP